MLVSLPTGFYFFSSLFSHFIARRQNTSFSLSTQRTVVKFALEWQQVQMRWNSFTFLLVACLIGLSHGASLKGESCRCDKRLCITLAFCSIILLQLDSVREAMASAVKRATASIYGPIRLIAQFSRKFVATTIMATQIHDVKQEYVIILMSID